MATKEVVSNEYLLPQDRGSIDDSVESGCSVTRDKWAPSFNCSVHGRYEYAITNELEEFLASYEAAGWYARGTTRDVFLREELRSENCASLLNDNLYPGEKVRIHVCRQTNSVIIKVHSSYRPSLLMMLYLGIRA